MEPTDENPLSRNHRDYPDPHPQRGVQRNLTVPTGVTLELAGDSAIWIQRDGVTLTVNGTVNAPSNRIGFDTGSGARTMNINGNGTINLTGKGSLLIVWSGDGDARKLTLEGVTLAGLPDNDEPLVGVYEGAELVMVSGAIRGNGTSHPGAGVFVDQGSIFTMSGGTISGNTASDGGGVFVGNGTFIMEGGTISGNTSHNFGGGVGVFSGTFTMTGGAISGNSAVGERDSRGGGVSIDKGTITMEGGTIFRNRTSCWAGGVWIDWGTFTMKGGVIFGNTAEGGGGVDVSTYAVAFIMEGGRIQGGTDSDGFTRNTSAGVNVAALGGGVNSKKIWGTGGTYTIGGVNQTGDGNIGNTSDTLIAHGRGREGEII